jgi:hypothetical protein
VFQNLVIVGNLLLVLFDNAIHAIDRSICHELLELWVLTEALHIRMEDTVVSVAEAALGVLIRLTLRNTVREGPSSARLSISARLRPLLGEFKRLMPTHINESLLVEEFLLGFVHQTLTRRLDTETFKRLDERGTRWQLTSLNQLV